MKLFLSTIVTALLIIVSISSYGSPAYPRPVKFTQPDGTIITVLLKGDENSKWAETTDGYSIVFNEKGYYEYGTKDTRGFLVPSGIVVKPTEARSNIENTFLLGVEKHLTYSLEQHKMFRTVSYISNDHKKRSFPTKGDRKLICILIGFSDLPFQKNHTDFDNLFNQVNYSENGAVGSVKDYYLENSLGQFNLTVTVAGPYTASNTMAYYGENNSSKNDSRPRTLVEEAVTLADNDVNYADFDNDNDGTVDGVYIIYAGYGEEAGASADAIWAHAWSISPKTLDGKTVSRYSCSAELRSNLGTNITGIGVICHEFGHVLGAPDYYDTDYAESGGQFPGLGNWDLMASGSWNNQGLSPANHNPYTKTYIYDWVTTTTITSPQSISIYPTNNSQAKFYRINTKTPNEYFLLENRQNVGFDQYLPGHGLMIYRIHKDFNGLLPANDLNVGYPQMMTPVKASNKNVITSAPSSFGNINLGDTPFPGTSSVTEFTDNTLPSQKSWDNLYTGVPITQITENGIVVELKINETADFYASETKKALNDPITFTDNSFGAITSWEWNFGDGAVPQTANTQGPIQVTYTTPGVKTVTLTLNGTVLGSKIDYINIYDPSTTPTDILTFDFEDKNLLVDGGTPTNKTKSLTYTSTGALSYNTGVGGGYALNGAGWDSGSGVKAWTIAVDAGDYHSLKLSSSQASSSAGPKNFKLQYKVGNGNWVDVPGATAILTTTFAEQLSSVQLPSDCNNKADLSIRWIMTDNVSASGAQVTAGGLSKIDNIKIAGILGQGTTGIEPSPNDADVQVFPNPFTSSLSIKTSKPIKNLLVYDISGKLIIDQHVNGEANPQINTSSLSSGYYLIKLIDYNENATTIKTVKQ